MILKFEKFVKSVEILQKYVFIHLVLCQFCPASDPTVLSISKGLGWAGMVFYGAGLSGAVCFPNSEGESLREGEKYSALLGYARMPAPRGEKLPY